MTSGGDGAYVPALWSHSAFRGAAVGLRPAWPWGTGDDGAVLCLTPRPVSLVSLGSMHGPDVRVTRDRAAALCPVGNEVSGRPAGGASGCACVKVLLGAEAPDGAPRPGPRCSPPAWLQARSCGDGQVADLGAVPSRPERPRL